MSQETVLAVIIEGVLEVLPSAVAADIRKNYQTLHTEGMQNARYARTSGPRLFDAIAHRMGAQPGLGVELAERFQLSRLHRYLSLVAACEDLRMAALVAARYGAAIATAYRSELGVEGGEAVYQTWRSAQSEVDLEAEFRLALGMRATRALVPGFELTFAALPVSEEYDLSRLNDFLGVRVAKGATHHIVRFDAKWLDAPLRGFDAERHAVLGRRAERDLAAARQLTILGRAEAEFDRAASRGDANVATVARRLGIAERTLRRLLIRHSSSPRDEKERALRIRTLQLLGRKSAVEDVARQTGYGNSSSLARSFRRWFGTTPLRFRNKYLGALGALSDSLEGSGGNH